MTSFNPFSIAFDAWRVTRENPEMLVCRQKKRLSELVTFTRKHSPFYAKKYRHLPENITDVQQLPPLTKTELMEHFDDVVTDTEVKRRDVEIFLADKNSIGTLFKNR